MSRKRTWRRRSVTDDAILTALKTHAGNVTHAAAELGVDRRTLGRWLKADPSLSPAPTTRKPGRIPRPRAGQSIDGWARWVRKTYAVDETGARLLELAVNSWQRFQQARAAIDEHGLTQPDGRTLRPEVQVEKDSRAAFQRVLQQLGLEHAGGDE